MSDIKTINHAINSASPEPFDNEAKQKEVEQFYAVEKATKKKMRMLSIGAPQNKLMESGFDKWENTNERGRVFYSKCVTFCENIQKIKDTSFNFIISGPSGSGKTFAALSCCRFIVDTQKDKMKYQRYIGGNSYVEDELPTEIYRTAFWTKGSILVAVTQEKDPEKKRAYKLACETSDLLVIDEVGRTMNTRIEKECIFSIVDYRVDHNLSTIIVSNFNGEELRDHLGAATISRLMINQVSFDTTGIGDKRVSY